MRRLHVIGRKNHGKTELLIALVAELTHRGLCVGTIKHSHHRHELDTPGKDSHRHRLAGAAVVGVLSDHLCAVFLPIDQELAQGDRYPLLAPLFSRCDLVLVEGDSSTMAPKIEVWRAELGTPPMARQDPQILAVVTDGSVEVKCPVLPRGDVPGLANWILHVSELAAPDDSRLP
jgi:molybdopterin-guanine dinucleotide biosynthesis protein MobB